MLPTLAPTATPVPWFSRRKNLETEIAELAMEEEAYTQSRATVLEVGARIKVIMPKNPQKTPKQDNIDDYSSNYNGYTMFQEDEPSTSAASAASPSDDRTRSRYTNAYES